LHGNFFRLVNFTIRRSSWWGECGPSSSNWVAARCSAKGNELASEIDFTIPHCVNTIDECIALIRENRTAWLAAQPAR
jgi:hypothetical protein